MSFLPYLDELNLVTAPGVNESDYYSDALLTYLLPILKNKRKLNSLLEIGTGRGYISLVLSRAFPTLSSIIATDIEDTALKLAKKNVNLNKLSNVISVKKGSLYSPAKGNKFDLIISVPPQLPITLKQLQPYLTKIPAYHITTSIGGSNGRKLLDKIIRKAPAHLNTYGTACFVHADFSNFDASMLLLKKVGLKPAIIGKYKKYLDETSVTKLIKPILEKNNYKFRKDKNGRLYFELAVITGTKYATSN